MKKYKIVVSVAVQEQTESYLTPVQPISFRTEENVPEGENPTTYLAARLSEELRRHSKVVDLEWQSEEETEEVQI